MTDKTRFQNRVALITGAGSETGIGFATARILAKGGAGVAITSTTDRIYERAKAMETEVTAVIGYTADLMDRDQVKSLVHTVISDFGHIDILVNNAGMVQMGKEETFSHLVELARAEWDESIGRN